MKFKIGDRVLCVISDFLVEKNKIYTISKVHCDGLVELETKVFLFCEDQFKLVESEKMWKKLDDNYPKNKQVLIGYWRNGFFRKTVTCIEDYSFTPDTAYWYLEIPEDPAKETLAFVTAMANVIAGKKVRRKGWCSKLYMYAKDNVLVFTNGKISLDEWDTKADDWEVV